MIIKCKNRPQIRDLFLFFASDFSIISQRVSSPALRGLVLNLSLYRYGTPKAIYDHIVWGAYVHRYLYRRP